MYAIISIIKPSYTKISFKVLISGPRGDMAEIEFYSPQSAAPDIFNNPNLKTSIKTSYDLP